MKNTRKSTIIAIGLVLINCTADKSTEKNSALIGKWNWVSSTGGISGTISTSQSTGQNIKIEITDKEIKKYTNERLVLVSTYSIQSGKSIYGDNQQMITYDNKTKESFYLTNDNKQLTLKE